MASTAGGQGNKTHCLSAFHFLSFLLLTSSQISTPKILPIGSWLKVLGRKQQMSKDSHMPEEGSVSNNNSCTKGLQCTVLSVWCRLQWWPCICPTRGDSTTSLTTVGAWERHTMVTYWLLLEKAQPSVSRYLHDNTSCSLKQSCYVR